MSLTASVFLLVFLVGLVAAFVRGPIFGLYAYVWAFYLNPPSRWWGDSLPDIRWSLVAAIVTLIAIPFSRNLDHGPPRSNYAPVWILGLYTAWMWLQTIWALDTQQNIEGAILFTKYVILFLLLYRILRTSDDLYKFSLLHVAGTFYLGLLAYTSQAGGRLDGVGGPGIGDANALAMHLTTGLVFAAFLFLHLTDFRRWLIIVMVPFVLNAVILTQSRGAVVALVAGGLASMFFRPKIYRRLFYISFILGILLTVILSEESFVARVATISAIGESPSEMDNSARVRLALISAGWEMFKDYPMGTGHRGTVVLSPYYLDSRYLVRSTGSRAAHNTFMAVLVEQGIPGALLFFALLYWVVRSLLRGKALESTGLSPQLTTLYAMLGTTFVVVFVAGLFVDFLKAEIQIWLLAMLASVIDLANNKSLSSNAPQRPTRARANLAAVRRARTRDRKDGPR